MAAPPEVTINNISGKWTMNKKKSDDQTPVLSLQGIGWVTRKAISLATVTLVIRQYEEAGVTHIDVVSTASGLSSTQEHRTLDWEERAHEDVLFGKVKGKSRLFKSPEFQSAMDDVSEDDKKWLLAEVYKSQPTSFDAEEHMQSVAVSQTDGWVADQIWGFETVDGERRYTRRVVCKKGNKTERIRLVYDYNGPLDG